MIHSYKLCIIILLEPVKLDIKRTQTKNKTFRKYLNDKIQLTFFCLPYGRWVSRSFWSIVFVYNYRRNKKFRIGKFEHFLRDGRVTGN